MLAKGCANSGPGGLRVPKMMWMDRLGFSLCAAPLKSSGPGFRGMWQRLDEQVVVQSISDQRMSEETWRVRGGVKIVNLVGDGVANLVDIQTGSTVHWRLAFITTGDYAGS